MIMTIQPMGSMPLKIRSVMCHHLPVLILSQPLLIPTCRLPNRASTDCHGRTFWSICMIHILSRLLTAFLIRLMMPNLNVRNQTMNKVCKEVMQGVKCYFPVFDQVLCVCHSLSPSFHHVNDCRYQQHNRSHKKHKCAYRIRHFVTAEKNHNEGYDNYYN